MKNQQIRFWVLFVVLVAGGAIITTWERIGEASVEREPLASLPGQLGAWRQAGRDERFSKEVEDVLRADDYVSRTFAAPDGKVASLYVGYHATQRAGATYHSPLNCLPGSGWNLTEPARSVVTPAGGAPAFEANRYIIERGGDRQLLLYWYQGRGRAVASEYKDKIHTVLDSVSRRRSDGAMVRVLMPVGTSEEETLQAATDLAAHVAPALPRFVPN
jgi:EpsI family protein